MVGALSLTAEGLGLSSWWGTYRRRPVDVVLTFVFLSLTP